MAKPKLTNQVKFPIGDWSGDGHGHVEWYTILTNKTIEELREIHFSCPELLGIEIGDICRPYGEHAFSREISFKLAELGVFEKANIDGASAGTEFLEDGQFYPNNWDGPRTMFLIWLAILKTADPTFGYEIVDDDIPAITFYGSDDKRRHLKNPGYGLFD
ncbi:MAG TPA: hypothetical protein VK147_02985 [Candidatus Didemnitutus sp.]|nr:hypothetical protein [Candidatus Didemnitutus sp.]